MFYRNNRKSLSRAEIYFRDNGKYRLEDSIMRDNLSFSLSVSLSDSINSNTLRERDTLLSEMAPPIHARNKLNDPLHAQQIVRRAIQPSLILIRSRKVGKVVTTTLRMTRVARRGATETLCILAQPFLDYEPYLLPIIQRRSPQTRRDGDIPIPDSIFPVSPPSLPSSCLALRLASLN